MEYNKYIDHTLLKSDATRMQIIELCHQGNKYHFASVCVNPYWVKTCKEYLKDSDCKVCCVIGFPLGATHSDVKAFEVKQAIADGVDEVDMVINVGALKGKEYQVVLDDILKVRKSCENKVLKVILETCLLTKEEIIKACELCVEAGVDFVKTSTGFSSGGARVEDVALMKQCVKDHALVKASGGIRTKEDMLKMIEVGASRIGTSNGVGIVEGK